ncbi:cdc42 effector protein 2-like [Struthio camelus]|uniref:cdc42 effector protein 2-like n=1 Tax=Struthio camelus TaxID=8801 RepID=UPI003603FCC8
MPAKTPIYLKTVTPHRGRKLRLRDVLSGEMISPPLGDFQHSAHIGLAGTGDMFGELSFLQGHYDLLPRLGQRPVATGTGEASGCCPPPGTFPPLLKSAVSLPIFGAPPKPPRLHLRETPGGQRSMSVSGPSAEGLRLAGLPRADPLPCSVSFPGPPVQAASPPEHPSATTSPLPRSESLLAFDLDLGPSILDDVLRIMDGYKLPTTEAL